MGLVLCGVCIIFLCLYGFSPASMASSDHPRHLPQSNGLFPLRSFSATRLDSSELWSFSIAAEYCLHTGSPLTSLFGFFSATLNSHLKSAHPSEWPSACCGSLYQALYEFFHPPPSTETSAPRSFTTALVS